MRHNYLKGDIPMTMKMYNEKDKEKLTRIKIDDNYTYNNLYDYIEKLFLSHKEKIDGIVVDIEKNNILTIVLNVNSTHNKEFLIKYTDNNTYKVIAISHYYYSGFSTHKSHSERLLTYDRITLPELLQLLDDFFDYPEI